jgi:hypothetical protein
MKTFPFYTETLEMLPLSDESKQLVKLSFHFEHPAELENVSAENYIFSRSVLESIFLRPNATHLRIESACGTINPVYFGGKVDINQADFPQNGVKLYIDEYANYELLLEALNEVIN